MLQFAKMPNAIPFLPAQQPCLSKIGVCIQTAVNIVMLIENVNMPGHKRTLPAKKLGFPKVSSAKLTQCSKKSCLIYTLVYTCNITSERLGMIKLHQVLSCHVPLMQARKD